MKNNQKSPHHKYILTIIALLFIFLSSSCSKKVTFITSQVVPSAQGYVKIDKDDNNNYTLDVNVKNLADPSRLTPSKKLYLVWMNSENNGITNLGQLDNSSGFFSKSLEGKLHTVTPFKPNRIFITAEDESNIQNPGGQQVLTTQPF